MATQKARIDNLLRRSLLGEELINTQFHLFTACSVLSHKAIRPQVLFANDALLVGSSDYFTKLLVEKQVVDAVVEFSGCCPYGGLPLDAYGYASDSDLEDEEDEDLEPPVISEPLKIELPEDQCSAEEVDPCEWLSSSGGDSSLQLMGDVEDGTKEKKREYTFSTTAVPMISNAGNVSPPCSLQSRHLFVKDTAFRTWQALLFYLYTDQISWSPLKSQMNSKETRDATVDSDGPLSCSPKSMYRLATKIALEPLKKLAFDALRSRLSEHNILQELSSSFTSKYPEVLKLQTDILYEHIASRPVVNGLPEVAKRIAQGKLPHGAEIIIALYQRVLTGHYPMAFIVASEEKADEVEKLALDIGMPMPDEVPSISVTMGVGCGSVARAPELLRGDGKKNRKKKKK